MIGLAVSEDLTIYMSTGYKNLVLFFLVKVKRLYKSMKVLNAGENGLYNGEIISVKQRLSRLV